VRIKKVVWNLIILYYNFCHSFSAPTLAAGVSPPQKTDVTNATVIKAEFKKAFNESNGPVLYYSVIVAENKDNVVLSKSVIPDDTIHSWPQVCS
jgi:hypothetical protein